MLSPLRKMRLFSTAIALTLFSFIAARPALGDSYQLTVVNTSQHESFYGIDAAGDFVVNLSADLVNGCGNSTPCYATYDVGQSSPVFSTTPPALNYDDGTPCSPILFPGFTPEGGLHGICNNGHSIVGGSDAQQPHGVWDGPDPIADLLLIGSFDGGFMNANGDAVFVDGLANTLISAVDLTTASTPEPSSFVLLATGCLSMLGAFRRFART
jgi:hypothetical protein